MADKWLDVGEAPGQRNRWLCCSYFLLPTIVLVQYDKRSFMKRVPPIFPYWTHYMYTTVGGRYRVMSFRCWAEGYSRQTTRNSPMASPVLLDLDSPGNWVGGIEGSENEDIEEAPVTGKGWKGLNGYSFRETKHKKFSRFSRYTSFPLLPPPLSLENSGSFDFGLIYLSNTEHKTPFV